MDKNILIEYCDMKEEIKDLRRRIENDRRELDKLNKLIVSDSVACGKKGKKPIRTVKIQGKPNMAITHRQNLYERRIKRLERVEQKLLEMTNEVEEYIESIKKSELRIMFRFYYIDGLTWIQVAHRMNDMFPKKKIKYSEDSCRTRNERFFNKSQNVR